MIYDTTFLAIINIIPNPLIIFQNKKVILSNQSFLDFFGLDSVASLNKGDKSVCAFFVEHPDYLSPNKLPPQETWIEYLLKHPQGTKVSMLNANGEGRAFELTAGHLPDAEDMYMLIFTDITTLQNEKKIFEKLSITDTLTGLYNRRYFNEILDSEISRASQQQSTLSFIICDIDFFKKYNDAYGHQAGDTALSSVAKAINSSINRGTDFAFRLGGEEFGIIFSTSDKEMSLELANKIRTNVEALQIENSKSTVSSCVTISLGLLVVDFSIESVDKNGFYSMADDALYKAKNNGRNQVVLYENGDVENA